MTLAPILRPATCEYVPGVVFQINVRLTSEQRSRLELAADFSPPGTVPLLNRWNAAQAAYTAAIDANPELTAQLARIEDLRAQVEQAADDDQRASAVANLTEATTAYDGVLQADPAAQTTQAALLAHSEEYDALRAQVLVDYYTLLSAVYAGQTYPYDDALTLDLSSAAAARATMEHPEIDALVKYWLAHVPLALADAEVANISTGLKELSRGTISPPRPKTPPPPPDTAQH